MRVRKGVWLTAVLCLAASVAGAVPDRPVTVSPGSVATVEAASALCPTFSWGGVDEAQSYEIMVYALAGSQLEAAAPGGRPALSATLPGSASSWTPAADRCLAAGTAYVWFVRAVGPGNAAGEWSEGGMFRTPIAIADVDLRREVLQMVERYLAAPGRGGSPNSWSGSALAGGQLGGRRGLAAATSPRPETRASSDPDYGLLAIIDSSEESSSAVAGFNEATTGEVAGVAGFSASEQGYGVYGENSNASGGVGVRGSDGASSGITAGVVGTTQNAEGYGGFFWNESDTGGDALVVADPENHPTTVDVKLFVDVDGNLGLVGVVKFEPTDSPTEGCIADTEGAIYYDLSEAWLCVCTKEAGPTYKWRRADDKNDDCST